VLIMMAKKSEYQKQCPRCRLTISTKDVPWPEVSSVEPIDNCEDSDHGYMESP